jgi:diguanylate cyclase (GGDEF)-like protein
MDLFSRWRPASQPALAVRDEQRRLTEAVLRSAASLIASDDDARTTITRHCETLTALVPHIMLAWTWFGPSAATRIEPQVMAGPAAAYARTLCIERSLLTEIGPAFRTLAGKQLEPFNVSTLSPFGPWRQAAAQHGVRSVLALPLKSTFDDQSGLFVLYADVERYFEQVGVGVFDALGHLFSAVLSRAARNAELARAANCDALTGLSNRHAVALLDPELRRITAHDKPVSVVMLDIDHFKHINDQHGHPAGDQVLRLVARLLQATVRQTDTVARWGGEEFVVCLPGTDLPMALAVAEKLRHNLAAEDLALAPGLTTRVTASLGVAELQAGESVVQGITRADQALYAAKHGGRDRVQAAPMPAQVA